MTEVTTVATKLCLGKMSVGKMVFGLKGEAPKFSASSSFLHF
jgi:hypothetical protein